VVTDIRVSDTGTGADHALDPIQRAWALVPGSAKIGWTARKRYFMVIPVTASGSFSQVAGTISIPGERFEEAKATIRIPVTSHSSGQAKRDKHLLGRDFFDADQYAFLTFESTHIRPLETEVGAYEVSGLLTVRETSVPIVLTGTLEPYREGDRAHVSLAGMINRRDVGMVWNAVPMLKLHDDIRLTIEVDIEPA